MRFKNLAVDTVSSVVVDGLAVAGAVAYVADVPYPLCALIFVGTGAVLRSMRFLFDARRQAGS